MMVVEKNVVKKEDARYPSLLRDISDAPKQLYYKGEWRPELFEQCLAVVGARRMTSYGKKVTEQIAGEVAAAGITIVSGFMYGIDETAHRAAVRAGGKTIAVMPCGINIIHPEYQADLYREITETGGLILSEFAGNFPPATWTYPKRNRIVAGLSQATLVVEAGERSGALITAGFVRKYGRKLFVVPGPITSPVSRGITQLLKGGAEVASCARDILDSYGLPSAQVVAAPNPHALHSDRGNLEGNIVRELAREPLHIDELARLLGAPVELLGTTLSLMELAGAVFEEQGKYYAH